MGKLGLVKNDASSRTLMIKICRLFRRLAIAEFLLQGSKQPFARHLGHSAQAWLAFLQQAPEKDRIAAQGLGLFDAVAGGHLPLAQAIAQATPSNHNPVYEYEEDYLYVRLIAELLLNVMPLDQMQLLLDQWEALLEGRPDFRFSLLALFLDEELPPEELNEGLLDAIDEMIEWNQEQIDALLFFPEDEATLCFVSTEVLTWLYLAEQRGVVLDEEYPLAPSLARFSAVSPAPAPDAWRNLPDTFSSPA